MKINLSVKKPTQIKGDLQILLVNDQWQQELAFLPEDLKKIVIEAGQLEHFKGEKEEKLFVDVSSLPVKKLLFYGVDKKEFSIETIQQTVAKALIVALKSQRRKISLKPYQPWLRKIDNELLGQAVSEAIFLSSYRFAKYKKVKQAEKKDEGEELIILVPAAKLSAWEKGVKTGEIYSQATFFARDLVNEPASVTTPSFLAEKAQELAKHNKEIKVTIWDKEAIAKLGMNCFLGVAQGSDHPPKFIRLSYRPFVKPAKKIVLIGKGITFDTGGLSLKPGQAMETMKIDMAGAASVLAVFSQIVKVKPKLEVVGLIAACENMPSGKALHPGDILCAMNGKTVEVLNTDAEGRLTLADVLSYAVIKEKPDFIVDLATLTGACMVALGEEIAGLYGNNRFLLEKVKQAAKETGELVWEMPLYQPYKEALKSHVADLRNVSKSKYGGSITAALFLEEFVGGLPWVHLDIAGPAYIEKKTPLNAGGGSGFGVRLLLKLLSLF